jgi:hypothetical protein
MTSDESVDRRGELAPFAPRRGPGPRRAGRPDPARLRGHDGTRPHPRGRGRGRIAGAGDPAGRRARGRAARPRGAGRPARTVHGGPARRARREGAGARPRRGPAAANVGPTHSAGGVRRARGGGRVVAGRQRRAGPPGPPRRPRRRGQRGRRSAGRHEEPAGARGAHGTAYAAALTICPRGQRRGRGARAGAGACPRGQPHGRPAHVVGAGRDHPGGPATRPPPGPRAPRPRTGDERRRTESPEPTLEEEAQRLWERGELAAAERKFRDVVRVAGDSQRAELAYGDLFVLARQLRGAGGPTSVWREYLERFPRGRFAEDARGGLCRRATGDERTACWRAYLSHHPDGTHRAQATAAVGGAP